MTPTAGTSANTHHVVGSRTSVWFLTHPFRPRSRRRGSHGEALPGRPCPRVPSGSPPQ